MTVLYVDQYLALNFAVDYLLLACAGKLTGDGIHRRRWALAGALGAAYAGLTLLPPWGFLEHPFCKGGAAVLMLLVAFGRSRRLLRTGGLFLVLSCAFGGGLLLLAMARGQGPGPMGVLAAPGLGMRGILVAAAVGYGGLSLLLREQFTHTRTAGELAELRLTHRGREVTLLALRDTGNTLRDPLTGHPVLVVEGEKLRDLVPELSLDRASLSDPAALLRRGWTTDLGLQLLPYRAVGVECGLLLALRLDRVEWDRGGCRHCLTALSPTPVSDGGGYCALLGGEG